MKTEKKIINKPWGSESIWAHTKDYVGKILFINKGHRLSKQYHEKKEETILVKSGTLSLEVGEEKVEYIELGPGEAYHISPGTVHRFCALSTDVVLIEVSTPELGDVVRLQDDYNRSV